MNKFKIIYKKITNLSDEVWSLVRFWSPFNQTIVGNEFIKSLDSITIDLSQIITKKTKNQDKILQNIKNNLVKAAIYNDIARRRRIISKNDYQNIYVQINKLKNQIFPDLKIRK